MTDAGPQIAGRYEILREIGRGGMAIVYAARQPDLDRQVALKELSRFHAGSVEFAHRFLRESRLAGSLNHPNIVTVYEYFEHDGTPYIAMEYVPRGSLRRYMKGMTLPQIAGVLEGVLAGLAHAETAGIVHRDLKPENIMVAGDGRVKITDFGIARATQSAGTAYVTATGMTVGTPTYMAPEQAMAADIGPWTDLYSAGVLAYELLVGHVPFHDTDAPMVILMRHVNERIASPIEERPDIDSQLSQWVDSLLVKDPAKRVRHAPTAWESLEDIIVGLLGPMWRRNARLLDDQLAVRESDPLTPAPFESQSSIRTPTPESSKAAEVFVTFDPALAAAPETPVAGPEAGPEAVPGAAPGAAAEVVPPAAADAPAPNSAGGAGEEDSGTDGFVTFGRPVAAPEPVPQAPAPVPPPPETAPAAPGTAPAAPDLTEAPVPVVPGPEAEPPPSRPEPMPPPVLTPEPMATPPPAPEPEAAEPEPESEPEPEPERESVPVAAAMAAPAAQTAASDGRAQRSLAPLAVLVVILAAAAAAAGFVVAPSSTKQANSPAPLSGAGAAGPVTISYPAGWRRSPTVPAPASALKLANPLALLPGQAARGGAFVIGIAPRVGPTLLPRTLTSSLKTAPSGSVVRIGSLGYRRYLGIVPTGASGPEIVYALPTSLGTVIAVCAAPSVNPPAFAAQCERVLGTMALSTGKVLPLSGNPGYAKELSSIINRLSAARNKDGRGLAIAKTQKAQAAAAQKVSADVSRAAAAVARLSPGPIGATGNAAVAAALRRIAAGYAALAVAAAHNQGSAYGQARSSISAADSALRGAFAQLKQAGYKAG